MHCANTATAFLKDKAADEQVSPSRMIGRAKLLPHSDASQPDLKQTVLDRGSCEALKLVVHAATLGLAVVMGTYNAAAWLRRREQHLAVNAVLYTALIVWEREHVAHHLTLLRQSPGELK